MATEAASLFVKVTGDVSDATRKMDQVSDKANKTGGILSNALGTAVGFAGAQVAMMGIGSAMGVISGGAIDMNAQLETSTLQFQTLMGSSEKATAKVQELFAFAAKTPFESGPIIEASRVMQTFGGDALNSSENLKLFGDAAAATSAPIDEVSFWMSRAYAAIQGGQPFGEARMRLMELGIITPQVAGEMEKMQKELLKQAAAARKSGDETKAAALEQQAADTMWGQMTTTLSKFDGAMERQAGTWEGLTSTMSDNVNMMMANAFKPLFGGLKDVLGGLNSLMASEAFQGGVTAVATAISAALQFVISGIQTLVGWISPLVSGFTGLQVAGDSVGASLGTMAASVLTGLATMAQQLVTGLLGLQLKMASWILDALPGAIANMVIFAQTLFDWVVNTGVPMAASAVAGWASKMVDWVTTEAVPKMQAALPKILSAIVGFVQKNGPVLVQKLLEWGRSFVSWVIPNIPPLLKALAELLASILKWAVTEGIPGLLKAAVDMGGALLDGIMDSVLGQNGQGKGILASIVDFFLNDFVPGVGDLAGDLLALGVDLATELGKGFANTLIGLVEAGINAIIDAINSIRFDIPIDLPTGTIHIKFDGFNLPHVSLPRFEKGAWEIPQTGMAIVHKGEMVVPAAAADEVRSGQFESVGKAPVQVTVQAGAFVGTKADADRFARTMLDALSEESVRRGGPALAGV